MMDERAHYPASALHALLDAIDPHPLGGVVRIFDPCSVDGNLRDALESYGGGLPYDLTLNNWRQQKGVPHRNDYLSRGFEWERHDICIMDPPNSEAVPFIRRALQHNQTVYALRRHDWMSQGRLAKFFNEMQPDVFVLPYWMSYDGRQGVAYYDWYRWPNQGTGIRHLERPAVAVREAEMKAMRRKLSEDPRQMQLPHTGASE